MNEITSSPLCWPAGWERAEQKIESRFGKYNQPISIAKAIRSVLDELRLMGIKDSDVIISSNLRLRNDGLPYSNQKEPDDSGASVWWRDGDDQRVIALDQYKRIADNIYAIGKTIEAMRGIKRWGGGEILNRTFTGFNALPSPDDVPLALWRDVLNYHGDDMTECEKAYKKARSENHPDRGGDTAKFEIVQRAWEQARTDLLRC